METITSRENPRIRRLARLLRRREEREREGLFVCEGARLCADAAGSGLLRELYVTRDALRRYPELEALRAQAAFSCIIAEGVAQKIGDTKTPPRGVCTL